METPRWIQRTNRLRLRFNRRNLARIGALKQAHAGEQCVIVATEPSLKPIDLELLDGHPFVFGVNGAFRVYDDFRYYFSSDGFYSRNHESLRQASAERLFLSSHVPRVALGFGDDPRAVYLSVDETQTIAAAGRFETDLTKTLYRGPTVLLDLVFPAALWMGFSEIVLVGPDFALDDAMYGGSERALVHEGFAVVKRELDRRRVRVFNCSPHSSLNVFEKPLLEAVLARRLHSVEK